MMMIISVILLFWMGKILFSWWYIYKYNKIFYSNVYKDFHNKQNNVFIVPQFIRLIGEVNLQNDWFLVVSEYLVKITHTKIKHSICLFLCRCLWWLVWKRWRKSYWGVKRSWNGRKSKEKAFLRGPHTRCLSKTFQLMPVSAFISDDVCVLTAVYDLGAGRLSQWTAAAVTAQRLLFPVLRVFAVKASTWPLGDALSSLQREIQ